MVDRDSRVSPPLVLLSPPSVVTSAGPGASLIFFAAPLFMTPLSRAKKVRSKASTGHHGLCLLHAFVDAPNLAKTTRSPSAIAKGRFFKNSHACR